MVNNKIFRPEIVIGNQMSGVSKEGYVVWKTSGRAGQHKVATWRDWRLVQATSEVSGTIGNIGRICLPQKYIGKRIRVKIEIME